MGCTEAIEGIRAFESIIVYPIDNEEKLASVDTLIVIVIHLLTTTSGYVSECQEKTWSHFRMQSLETPIWPRYSEILKLDGEINPPSSTWYGHES